MLHRVALAVLLLAVVGVAACGDHEPAQGASPHWRTRQDLDASLYLAADAQVPHEILVLTLPQARQVRADDAPVRQEWLRLVLNERDDRQVFFKGYAFDFAAERDEAAKALRRSVAELLSASENREPGITSRTRVMLHVDRSVPWIDVRELLGTCVEPPVGIEHVQVAIQSTRRGHDLRMDLRMLTSRQSTPNNRVELRLSREGSATALTVGERTFTFGPGDRLDDESFVRHANRTWDAVGQHLKAVPRTNIARLRTDEAGPVPWAYFVKTLDLLANRGIRVAHLPDEQLQIEILVPPSGS